MSYVEKNPWILHFDGSGCSGCGMEVQACFSPKFDVEQYGVRKTDNPKHADRYESFSICSGDESE